jgi:putrescine transport system ATP-binding protein
VGHGVSATLGSQVSVALRPEKVRLLNEAPADAQYNCMRGRITETGYFGSYSLYRMAVDGGLELKIEMLHGDRHGEPFQRGDEAFATFAPDALVVLTS